MKSSHPCRAVPSGPRDASHSSTVVLGAERNNSPTNLIIKIPSKRTLGPYHCGFISSDSQKSSVGDCQSKFMPRGIEMETSNVTKRTLSFNDPVVNSFEGRASLKKSGQKEINMQNYVSGMYSF